MKEGYIYEYLCPYTSPLSQVVDYPSFDLVSEETSCCVCANACHDHVQEVVGDDIVFELHMVVEVVVRVCCWKLYLLFKVTIIGAIQ